MTKIDLSKIDLNKIDISKFNTDNLASVDQNLVSKIVSSIQSSIYNSSNFKKTMEQSERLAQEAFIKKEQYEQDVLNTLKKIEGNTANLTTLVKLIQSSNENKQK